MVVGVVFVLGVLLEVGGLGNGMGVGGVGLGLPPPTSCLVSSCGDESPELEDDGLLPSVMLEMLYH